MTLLRSRLLLVEVSPWSRIPATVFRISSGSDSPQTQNKKAAPLTTAGSRLGGSVNANLKVRMNITWPAWRYPVAWVCVSFNIRSINFSDMIDQSQGTVIPRYIYTQLAYELMILLRLTKSDPSMITLADNGKPEENQQRWHRGLNIYSAMTGIYFNNTMTSRRTREGLSRSTHRGSRYTTPEQESRPSRSTNHSDEEGPQPKLTFSKEFPEDPKELEKRASNKRSATPEKARSTDRKRGRDADKENSRPTTNKVMLSNIDDAGKSNRFDTRASNSRNANPEAARGNMKKSTISGDEENENSKPTFKKDIFSNTTDSKMFRSRAPSREVTPDPASQSSKPTSKKTKSSKQVTDDLDEQGGDSEDFVEKAIRSQLREQSDEKEESPKPTVRKGTYSNIPDRASQLKKSSRGVTPVEASRSSKPKEMSESSEKEEGSPKPTVRKGTYSNIPDRASQLKKSSRGVTPVEASRSSKPKEMSESSEKEEGSPKPTVRKGTYSNIPDWASQSKRSRRRVTPVKSFDSEEETDGEEDKELGDSYPNRRNNAGLKRSASALSDPALEDVDDSDDNRGLKTERNKKSRNVYKRVEGAEEFFRRGFRGLTDTT